MYEIFERLCSERGVTPYRVCKETGLTTSTISNWKAGRYVPKQDKLKKIADYFGVSVEYIMGSEEDENVQYYLNDETREIAQEIFENKDLRILFDASRKAKPDDLKLIIEMAKRFKGED